KDLAMGDSFIQAINHGRSPTWKPGESLSPMDSGRHTATSNESTASVLVGVSQIRIWDSKTGKETASLFLAEEHLPPNCSDLLWEVDPFKLEYASYTRGEKAWKTIYKKHIHRLLIDQGSRILTSISCLPQTLHRLHLGGMRLSLETLKQVKYNASHSTTFKESASVFIMATAQSPLSNTFCSSWYKSVKDKEQKSYRRLLERLKAAQLEGAKLLDYIKSLREGTSVNRVLPEDWLLTFSNLKELELQVNGDQSSLIEELRDSLPLDGDINKAINQECTTHASVCDNSDTEKDIRVFEDMLHQLDQEWALSNHEGKARREIESLSEEKLYHVLQTKDGKLLGLNQDAPPLRWHQLVAVEWLKRNLFKSAGMKLVREEVDHISQDTFIQEPPPNSKVPNMATKDIDPSFGMHSSLILGDAPGLGKTAVVMGLLAQIWAWNQFSDETAWNGRPNRALCFMSDFTTANRPMLQHLTSLDGLDGPVVIGVPTSILHQWRAESITWLQHGIWGWFEYPTSRNERPSWWKQWQQSTTLTPIRVVLVSFSSLCAELKDERKKKTTFLGLKPWMIIVDEVHYARNSSTELYSAIKILVRTAIVRIGLTGTPIYNRLEDALNIGDLLGIQHALGREGQLVETYLRKSLPSYRVKERRHRAQQVQELQEPNESPRIILGDESLLDQISFGREFVEKCVVLVQALYKHSYLRRDQSATDWHGNPLYDLPPKKCIRQHIILSDKERSWYNEQSGVFPAPGTNMNVLIQNASSFFSSQRRGLIHILKSIATSKKTCQWIESGAAPDGIAEFCKELPSSREDDFIPSSKLDAAVKIVKEILDQDKSKSDKQRRKIIIYCVWTGIWDAIEQYFRSEHIHLLRISSHHSLNTRARGIEDFQREGPHKSAAGHDSWVVLISSAMSTGLTMTRGSVLIELETAQVEGRIYRMGQTRPVEIFQLVARNTIDDMLVKLSATKGALMELFDREIDSDLKDLWNDLPTPPALAKVSRGSRRVENRRKWEKNSEDVNINLLLECFQDHQEKKPDKDVVKSKLTREERSPAPTISSGISDFGDLNIDATLSSYVTSPSSSTNYEINDDTTSERDVLECPNAEQIETNEDSRAPGGDDLIEDEEIASGLFDSQHLGFLFEQAHSRSPSNKSPVLPPVTTGETSLHLNEDTRIIVKDSTPSSFSLKRKRSNTPFNEDQRQTEHKERRNEADFLILEEHKVNLIASSKLTYVESEAIRKPFKGDAAKRRRTILSSDEETDAQRQSRQAGNAPRSSGKNRLPGTESITDSGKEDSDSDSDISHIAIEKTYSSLVRLKRP
ncbi:hypothetical protein CPB86DRAFT_802960, partial [Serendipita vermifera]